MKKKLLAFFLLLGLSANVSSTTQSDCVVRYSLNSSSAADSCGSFDGSTVGSPTTGASGVFDSAWSFDGSSDGINTPSGLDSNQGYSDLSFSLHVKPESTSGNDRIINGGSIDKSILLRVDDNKQFTFYLRTSSGTWSTVSAPATLGSYQHVAGTFDASTNNQSIWVNGQLEGTTTTGADLNAWNLNSLMYYDGSNDRYVDGSLDEFRMYSSVLTATEIQNLNSSNSLTASTNDAPSLSNPVPSDGALSTPTTDSLCIDYSDADGDSGTVTFNWKNGTQIQQNTGVSSGTQTCTSSISLSSGTTYEWFVTASDGNGGSTSAGNYTFTTQSSSTNTVVIEDFESGTDGWTGDTSRLAANNSYSNYVGNGNYYGVLDMASSNNPSVSYTYSSQSPTNISFYAGYDVSTISDLNYYRIQSNGNTVMRVVFDGYGSGQFGIAGDGNDIVVGSTPVANFTTNQLYRINLANIDWSNHQIGDVYIDGNRVASNIGFTGNYSSTNEVQIDIAGNKGTNLIFDYYSFQSASDTGGTPGSLTLDYTRNGYVYQRMNDTHGYVWLNGTYSNVVPNAVEVNLAGQGWKTLDSNPSNGVFEGRALYPVSQGKLQVRIANNTDVNDSFSSIGVGEQLFFYGQSNVKGQLNYQHSVTHSQYTAKCWTYQDQYKDNCADPLFPTNTNTGSYIVFIIEEIMQGQDVPVMATQVAYGGLSINEFKTGGSYYSELRSNVSEFTMGRNNATGFVFIGTKDAQSGYGVESRSAMADALNESRNDLASDLSAPGLKVAVQQSGKAGNAAQIDEIRLGQYDTWFGDYPNLLPGGVSYNVTMGDNIHFKTDAEGREAAVSAAKALNGSVFGQHDGIGPDFVNATTFDKQEISVEFDESLSQNSALLDSSAWRVDNDGSSVSISGLQYSGSSSVNISLSSSQSGSLTVSLGEQIDAVGSNVPVSSSTGMKANTFVEKTVYSVDSADLDSPPNVSLSLNESQVYVNESFSASATASDDHQVTSIKYDWTSDGNYEASGSSAVHSYSSAGIYTVTAKATDNASQTSTDTASIEVVKNRTSTNKSILESCSSSSDAFCLENKSSPKKFTGGFTPEDNTTINYSVDVATGVTGTYTFYGFVNSTGAHNTLVESEKVNITVQDSSSLTNTAPTASFSASSTSVNTGESVSFDASGSSDPDGSIASYAWDFGDGSSASGKTTSHTYSSTGSFTVTLTVTDDNGSTTSATGTIDVSSSTSGGGTGTGDSGSGGTSGGDENTSTGGTTELDGSTAQLQSPHIGARYGAVSQQINEASSKTFVIRGQEQVIEVIDVNRTWTGIRFNGNFHNLSEGESFNGNLAGTTVDQTIYMPDQIPAWNSENASAIFTYLTGINTNTVPLNYNYSLSSDVNVSLQYRATGAGNNWQTVESVRPGAGATSSRKATVSVDQGIYEARVKISNLTDNATTSPVGFMVGEVPEIEILEPPKGKTYTRIQGPRVRLPIKYNATTFNSTKFGAYYYGNNGQIYRNAKTINTDVKDSSDVFDLLELAKSYSWISTFGVYGDALQLIQVPEQVSFTQELSVSVPGKEGDYTAYVNASSNNSAGFNATSIGQTAYLNIVSPTNETVQKSREEEIFKNNGRKINYTLHRNNSISKEKDFNSETSGNETFKDPYFAPLYPVDKQKVMVEDLNKSSITFYFDMGHGGTALLNRTIYIEKGNKTEAKIGLQPDKVEYSVPVNISYLKTGDWVENTNYTWYAVWSHDGTVVYNTSGFGNGSKIFTVEEKQKTITQLAGAWFNPVITGAATVYDANKTSIKLFIALFITIGWYLGFKINDYSTLAQAGAAIWFIFFSYIEYIPDSLQGLVLFIVTVLAVIKFMRGDINL